MRCDVKDFSRSLSPTYYATVASTSIEAMVNFGSYTTIMFLELFQRIKGEDLY